MLWTGVAKLPAVTIGLNIGVLVIAWWYSICTGDYMGIWRHSFELDGSTCCQRMLGWSFVHVSVCNILPSHKIISIWKRRE
jgi:hypothetical protein